MSNRWIGLLFFIGLVSCKPKRPDPVANRQWVKGADLSWVTEMESAGMMFYSAAGLRKDPFDLMKELGIEAIRLRVWVNPVDGWCGKNDVVAKAIRAKQRGLKILIDFHYSDFWADPGKQNPPAAWMNNGLDAMKLAIQAHTREILLALKAEGIRPDWVQVGNETNDGLLWPLGKASVSMFNYATLFRSGYESVKSVDSTIPVMVHLSNGYDASLSQWNLDGLKQHGAVWDVVGLSLYPAITDWQQLNQLCYSNMRTLIERYKTPVMLCEIGMPWDQANIAHDFIRDLLLKMDSLPSGMGLGVFYWEPQCYGGWKGYTLGAFDASGRPTRALQAFLGN